MSYKIISRSLIIITALFLVTSIGARAQDSVTDTDPGNIPGVGVGAEITLESVVLIDGVAFFDDQAAFNNTCAGLAVEDFEDTLVPPNSTFACTSPFNNSTSNDCYVQGALIPGFSLIAPNPSNPATAMVVSTPTVFGFTNVAAGANFFADDTVITFTDSVNAAGMVIVSLFGNVPVEVQVFNEANGLIGSAIVNLTGDVNGTFVGVLAQDSIARIVLESPLDEQLYELSFGACGVTRPIPTISEWGMAAVAVLLFAAGIYYIRRRQAA